MSNFSRVRAPGLWILGSTVDPAEWEAWDGRWEKVPNFADGSVHAPTVQVVIGGQGLEVSGDFIADECSLLHVSNNGAITLGTDAVVELGATGSIVMVSGSLISMGSGAVQTVGNGADVNIASGGDLNVQSGGEVHVQSGGTIQLDGTGELFVNSGAAITVANGGGLSVQSGGNVSVASGGNVTVASGATLTLQGRLALSGDAARVSHRIGTVGDANATIGAHRDRWLVPQDLTAPRTYTLDKTTHVPNDGDEIEVVRFRCTGGANVAMFKRESGTEIARFLSDGSEGGWLKFMYRAADGDWRVSGMGGPSASVSMPFASLPGY